MSRLVLRNAAAIFLSPQTFRPGDLLVERGRIAALFPPGTAPAAPQELDLGGRGVVLPGFQDAHGHLLGLARSLRMADLRGARSPEEAVRRLQAWASRLPPGEPLWGRGWDQTLWPDEAFPTRALLDRLFPDRPVFLYRLDGHAAWVNGEALRRAGITPHTPDPPGGRILRDAQGEPTGVLLDRAMELVAAALPKPSPETLRRALEEAARRIAALGITTVHDAQVSLGGLQLLWELAQEGRLPLRIYALLDGEREETWGWIAEHPPEGQLGPDLLAVRGVKLFADGALGSWGAALLESYADDPGNRGLLLLSESELVQRVRQALQYGYQVAVHAIGDWANRVVLNAYERVLTELQPPRSPRLRIEHAQVLSPQDLPRFRRLGVIASMQPIHCVEDFRWVEARLGAARARFSYAWRSLLAHGAILAFGSDFPVAPPSPFLGLLAATRRQTPEGEPPGGWFPQERIGLVAALCAYTRGAAFAAFAEERLGKIAPGWWADLVVLDRNPLQTPRRALPRIRVLWTLVGGRVVYARPSP